MIRKTRPNSRRRGAPKPVTNRKTNAGVMDRVERALPSRLGRHMRLVRTDLRALGKQIERNQRRYRRQLNDTVHQAERQVRRLRTERDKRTRRLKVRARRDAVRVLKRLEQSLEPPKPQRKAGRGARHKAQVAESRPRSSAATPAARDATAASEPRELATQ